MHFCSWINVHFYACISTFLFLDKCALVPGKILYFCACIGLFLILLIYLRFPAPGSLKALFLNPWNWYSALGFLKQILCSRMIEAALFCETWTIIDFMRRVSLIEMTVISVIMYKLYILITQCKLWYSLYFVTYYVERSCYIKITNIYLVVKLHLFFFFNMFCHILVTNYINLWKPP